MAVSTTTVNITIPEPVKEYIENRVTEKGYATTDDYILDLVREDRKRRDQEKLEALLLEGIDSGAPIEVTEEYIEEKRAELLARIHTGTSRGR